MKVKPMITVAALMLGAAAQAQNIVSSGLQSIGAAPSVSSGASDASAVSQSAPVDTSSSAEPARKSVSTSRSAAATVGMTAEPKISSGLLKVVEPIPTRSSDSHSTANSSVSDWDSDGGRVNQNTSLAAGVASWSSAEATIQIGGIKRINGRTYVVVNGELKGVGDLIEVSYEGRVYEWQIVGIDGDGRVQLEKHGIK